MSEICFLASGLISFGFIHLARFDRSTSTPVRNSQDWRSLLELGHRRLEHRISVLNRVRVGEEGKDHEHTNEVEWLGGLATSFNQGGKTVSARKCLHFITYKLD